MLPRGGLKDAAPADKFELDKRNKLFSRSGRNADLVSEPLVIGEAFCIALIMTMLDRAESPTLYYSYSVFTLSVGTGHCCV